MVCFRVNRAILESVCTQDNAAGFSSITINYRIVVVVVLLLLPLGLML